MSMERHGFGGSSSGSQYEPDGPKGSSFKTTGGRSLLHDEEESPRTPVTSTAISSRAEYSISLKRPAASQFTLLPPPPPRRHPPPHTSASTQVMSIPHLPRMSGHAQTPGRSELSIAHHPIYRSETAPGDPIYHSETAPGISSRYSYVSPPRTESRISERVGPLNQPPASVSHGSHGLGEGTERMPRDQGDLQPDRRSGSLSPRKVQDATRPSHFQPRSVSAVFGSTMHRQTVDDERTGGEPARSAGSVASFFNRPSSRQSSRSSHAWVSPPRSGLSGLPSRPESPPTIPRVPSPVKRDQPQAWFSPAPAVRDTSFWAREHVRAYDAGYEDAIKALEHGVIGIGAARYRNPLLVRREPVESLPLGSASEDTWRNVRPLPTLTSSRISPPHPYRRETPATTPRWPPPPLTAYPQHEPPYRQDPQYFGHFPGQNHHDYGAVFSRQPTRQLISCYPCRGRKLKCDGGKPCAQCLRRGSEGECAYATHVRRRGKGRKRDSEESSEAGESGRMGGEEMKREEGSSGSTGVGSGGAASPMRGDAGEKGYEGLRMERSTERVKVEPEDEGRPRYQLTPSPIEEVGERE